MNTRMQLGLETPLPGTPEFRCWLLQHGYRKPTPAEYGECLAIRGRGNGNSEPVAYPYDPRVTWDPLKPTVKVDTSTGTASVSTAPTLEGRVKAWLDEEMIAGVKNKYLALGALALWLWKRKS